MKSSTKSTSKASGKAKPALKAVKSKGAIKLKSTGKGVAKKK